MMLRHKIEVYFSDGTTKIYNPLANDIDEAKKKLWTQLKQEGKYNWWKMEWID